MTSPEYHMTRQSNRTIYTTAHSGSFFFFLCNTRIQNRRKESSDLDIRSQKDGGPGVMSTRSLINRLSTGDFIPSLASGGGLRPSNYTYFSVPPLAPGIPFLSICRYISAKKNQQVLYNNMIKKVLYNNMINTLTINLKVKYTSKILNLLLWVIMTHSQKMSIHFITKFLKNK